MKSLILLGIAGTLPALAIAKPNVLFFLVDDLGGRDLGTYGSTYHESPNIDALADSGMKFTQAYASCPVCSPTRAAIMTGKYPARVGITDWIPGMRVKDPEKRRVVRPCPIPAAGTRSSAAGLTARPVRRGRRLQGRSTRQRPCRRVRFSRCRRETASRCNRPAAKGRSHR